MIHESNAGSPAIRIMDCTIRDGGLVNDSQFKDDLVAAVYRTCLLAQIDYCEIGYINAIEQFPADKFGPWRRCAEEDLRRIVGENKSAMKLSAMADAGGKCNWRRDILPAAESALDMIRVAFYAHQTDEAIDMIADAVEKGYEVTANLMAISDTSDEDLDHSLKKIAGSKADVVVIVDSYGSLFPADIRRLVERYAAAIDGTGKEIGFHGHNNLQLGFANTLEAIDAGVTRVDATMAGLGRGAGNCPMELLLGALVKAPHRTRPVWDLIETSIEPLRETLDWGPAPHYAMTALANTHPRHAIAHRKAKGPKELVGFFDDLRS